MGHSNSVGGARWRTHWMILVGTTVLLHMFVAVLGDDLVPAPDVVLTNMFPKTNFHQALYAMWEPDHAEVSQDESSVILMLDHNSGVDPLPKPNVKCQPRNNFVQLNVGVQKPNWPQEHVWQHLSQTGCGIKSTEKFFHGFFSSSIKLPGNYSAGVVTTFYMSNNQDFPEEHDEFDFEFLGTIPGEPYTIQTNIYTAGRTKIGREQRFRLWFDPTEDFHDYGFLWNSNHTVFFVDSIPIWEFPNVEGMGEAYPSKQMSLYGTIWDASRWATDGGRYQVDYTFQPFLATYSNFVVTGCSQFDPSVSPDSCPPVFNKFIPPGLTKAQLRALHWVQANHRFYSYCLDTERYPDTSLVPECERERAVALSNSTAKHHAHLQESFLRIPIHSELLIHP